jgi:hypothetical protein
MRQLERALNHIRFANRHSILALCLSQLLARPQSPITLQCLLTLEKTPLDMGFSLLTHSVTGGHYTLLVGP